MTIDVIHLRGTWEPEQPPNISGLFLDNLDRSRFQVYPVDFPADYGRPMPFDMSNAVGRGQAVFLAATSPNRFILSGYSAGSFIAGDLAAEIRNRAVPSIDPDRLLAVVLIADPKRPFGAGAPGLPTPPGYGVAGQRAVPGERVWWGSSPRDPISALPVSSPLRTVADLTKEFSIDPRLWPQWGQSMLLTLIRRQVQPWWMFWRRPDAELMQAILELNEYVHAGGHTEAYALEGICTSLAQVVNNSITEGAA